ncbi:MAG: hypothetical protein LBT66_07115 [Methanobrevibacter sp.]|nr:hypothetical protein [Candidatus Methanovirga meridionalis]
MVFKDPISDFHPEKIQITYNSLINKTSIFKKLQNCTINPIIKNINHAK